MAGFVVDQYLDASSDNAVANRVVTSALENLSKQRAGGGNENAILALSRKVVELDARVKALEDGGGHVDLSALTARIAALETLLAGFGDTALGMSDGTTAVNKLVLAKDA